MASLFQPEDSLTFDDVMLVPHYSEVESRVCVDLKMDLGCGLILNTPIIASPMDTVCEWKMADAMSNLGGLGIIHRYLEIEDQVIEVKLLHPSKTVGAAVGATGDYLDRVRALFEVGVDVILVDVAHGDHSHTLRAVEAIKGMYPELHVMAGNVATSNGYRRLANAGADSVRVGVGSGSVCTTRIQTGHGIPILDSLRQIQAIKKNFKTAVIADGGIRNSGDAVKSFAFGADAIMLGSYLSGATETPGDIVNGHKIYRGMASKDAQLAWRGYVGGEEGVSTFVPHKGSVGGLIYEMVSGIKSGCSYSGCDALKDLHELASYVRITNAGMQESRPHGASSGS